MNLRTDKLIYVPPRGVYQFRILWQFQKIFILEAIETGVSINI